jgi:hypothetical protein
MTRDAIPITVAAFPFLPVLYLRFGCKSDTPVWLGVVPQPTPGRWPGKRRLGTLEKFLHEPLNLS